MSNCIQHNRVKTFAPALAFWLVLAGSLSMASGHIEMSPQDKEVILNLVREAGKTAPAGAEPFFCEKRLPQAKGQSKGVQQWLAQYRKTIDGTQGGPFEPTDGYVTMYRGNTVYLHIWDWKGQNNISLPAVIDREIVAARNLTNPSQQADYVATDDGVRQHPWGLFVIVPEDQRSGSHTIVALEIDTEASTLIQPRLIEAAPSQPIFLLGETARLEGGLEHQPGPDWIQGWRDTQQQASWRVQVRAAGDYEVALTYACPPAAAGSVLEIVSGSRRVTHTLTETKGWVGPKMNFQQRRLDEKFRLTAGVNPITLRLTQLAGSGEVMRLYTSQLISPSAQTAMAAAKRRAEKLRADPDWFIKAKYGVMFHWNPGTQPRHGAKKPFPQAVDDFDVIACADMVKETGAGYMVFTAPHGIHWFPGPIQAIEKILPGRTCRRDLLGELADALEERGIKLIQYYHHGVGDVSWSKASGFCRKDQSRFFQNEVDCLTEIGLRYGKKVAGFWFDDRYLLQPFEALYRATKAGNPDRLVAFNSWVMPKSTEFQDYYAGEFGGSLSLPDVDYFAPGGPAAGLQPHGMIFLDDPWAHGQPDTEIAPPIFKTIELIEYVKKCIARKMVITMNMSCYQDGTVSSATLEQMKAVRRAIREEREEDDKRVVKKTVKQKEPGLIGWWKFDEGRGDTAGDSSGYGNDGITGARWIDGVLGKALDFQGIECVQVPPEVFLSVTNEISITFWQYGNPHTQPMENSVFEAYTASNERVLNCHLPWPHESGTLIILDMAPNNRFSKLATPDEYKGRWNHWAFTKNAETGRMCMYLNGKMWHSIGGQTGKIEGIAKFTIGANANGAVNYDGALDDFRIYNRELTADEISKVHQDGVSQGKPDVQVSFVSQDADRQLQLEPVLVQPEGITVLMADRSKLSGGAKYNKLDPGKPFKRFWIDNWKSPDASIKWNITAPKTGEYEVAMLVEGAPGVEVEITGPDNTLTCELVRSGWDKVIVPGQLSLPQGVGVITVRLLGAADVKLKSVELINLDAKKNIERRVKRFRSSTKWLADAKYGLMFQWGEWGYPRHGDKKKWPKMIDDFDVESFADMVADTGAGYVIWSATWTTYYFPAPIKAIDDILPGRTSERDLIGELTNALDKRGVRLIVYYHLGHDNNPNLDWWKKNWVSSDDKEIFFTNLCAITTEIGKRYGRKLAGWMLDDGVVIYPASFERLGKALKAGSPDRIISYNSWIMPRFTEFQDFHFGEGNEQGAAGTGPKGGDGIVADGPQKGLQGHANFILDGPNWGIRSPETKINPPRWTKDQVAKMVKNAMEHKLALSFNLLMYEDGSVSPASLEMMRHVRKVVHGK